MIGAHPTATWFETRGVAALLTMRVLDLILRSPPQVAVSKDEATARAAFDIGAAASGH
jgi:hypothetical protein